MTENRPLSEAEALAALEWYRAAGVDVAVGETPVDRFAASAVAPRPKAPVVPRRRLRRRPLPSR